MKIKLLLVTLLISVAGFSQDFILKKNLADNYYDKFDFYKALPMYEQLLRSHPDDTALYEKLATGYDHINDSENAERCYAFLVMGKAAKPEYFLNYARALASNGKYGTAMTWYAKYSEVLPQDPRGAAFAEAYQNMVPFYRDSATFKIVKAQVSTLSSEFSPAYFGKSILFVTDKSGFSMIRSSYNWTRSSFLDLYLANQDGTSVKPFSDEVNSAYHEGPVTLNKTQDTIIFTRSNYFDSHLSKSGEGITKLGLFQASLNHTNNKWTDIHPLTLNSKEYSVQHPAVSQEGDKLYFASDMPGGMGGMDLYVSHRIIDSNGKASWGVPVNLGPGINSPGLEVFPFIDDQGSLWFASNGIPGLGGLDIFLAVKSGDGFSKAINPGYPLNTMFDDFGLITKTAGEEGYFSSDRNNAFGNDDIYQFNKQFIKRVVRIVDSRTEKTLSGTRIDVLEEGTEPGWFDNEKAAPVALTFNPFKSYKLGGSKSGYKPAIIALTREQLQMADTLVIPLIQEGPVFILNGLIYNASDKKPIPVATAMVFNKSIGSGHELKGDQAGVFHVGLLPETDYQITVADGTPKSGCNAAMLEISTKGLHRDSTFNLSVPVYCTGDVIAMEDIFYDMNKYNIRPDAAKVLDKLLKIMLQYPKMKIELRSHTDSRASAGYNLKLSDDRAKSAAAYLYSKGIARDRIVSKGYGETQLLNKCADGVPCSEAEHQLNRRTEFKILKL